MKANRISLLYNLCSIINENNSEDTNFTLALYFLKHYNELASLNIYDVATDCFVARASVRRFCIALGYENFLDLKHQFLTYDDGKDQYSASNATPNYREELTRSINEMIKELDTRMNTREVYHIAKRIHDSRNTIIITSGTSAGIARDFQQAMILQNKVIFLVSELYSNNELLKKMTKEDSIITISTTGTFAYASHHLIENLDAFKTLITINRDPIFNTWYDKIYHLCAQEKAPNAGKIYSTFGVNYVLDIIYSEYARYF